jgi:uncharacterized phage protein (TIGR02218 family)
VTVTKKTLGSALLAHYQGDRTTLCNLLRISAPDGAVLGITSLDADVTYDDGAGAVVYSAAVGMNSYPMDQSAGTEIDNSEALLLFAESGHFSPRAMESGSLDFGWYVVYRVNFRDLTMGHDILDVGTVGIVRNVDGLAGRIELRSLQQLLKQNYGRLYSRTCRAVFGSGGGGTCVEFEQCGFDAESLWQSHSVATVGAEIDRIFTANAAPAVNGPNGALTFAPGLVKWTSGANAGWISEIEAIDGADITLRFPTRYTIAASDEFDTRPDCDKLWSTCGDDYDNRPRFRGEPWIPVGDESSQSVPNFSGTWTPTQTLEPEVEP